MALKNSFFHHTPALEFREEVEMGFPVDVKLIDCSGKTGRKGKQNLIPKSVWFKVHTHLNLNCY